MMSAVSPSSSLPLLKGLPPTLVPSPQRAAGNGSGYLKKEREQKKKRKKEKKEEKKK